MRMPKINQPEGAIWALQNISHPNVTVDYSTFLHKAESLMTYEH